MTDPLSIDVRRRPWFRRLPTRRILTGAVVAFLLVILVPPLRRAAAVGISRVIVIVATPLAPDIDDFARLAETTDVLAADGRLLARLDTGDRREPVKLSDLPDHVSQAVLAAEDQDFYVHSGVDPDAVFRALLRNAQRRSEGGSTITQQLAKNNYAGSERTFARKLREVLYASKLEDRYSKDELLERYLNQIYFGENAYGLTTAAKTFFGKRAEELTVGEAATLAGKIRAPERLDPRTDPKRVLVRRDQVLANMAEEGWLTPAALEAARKEPLTLAPATNPEAARAPHFLEYVKREAKTISELGADAAARSKELFTGGLTVETTLDPAFYDATVAAVQAELGLPGDPAVAVVTVQPGDGAIRNLFGGLTFERKFDVASQGRRQPGSSYKPFAYLAMLEAGIDPRSMFDATSPQTFEHKGEVFATDNYEGGGGGQSNVDDAMVHSLNTVFMRLGLSVGPEKVVEAGRRVDDPADPDAISAVPSVSLGGLRQGVTPLEQAAAYAAFAARGTYASPYAVARIRDRDGRVIYERKRRIENAFNAEHIGVLNVALQRVVQEGTGRAANIGRPVAGKTGTTQNYGDAWFAGYVPQAATAVWVGDPLKITPMLDVRGRRVTGGSFPAAIFAAVMRAGLAGVPPETLHTASPDRLALRLVTTTTSTSTTTTAATTSTAAPTSTTTAVCGDDRPDHDGATAGCDDDRASEKTTTTAPPTTAQPPTPTTSEP